jgi:hypothetical protein
MNDNPQYPQILEVPEEVPLPKGNEINGRRRRRPLSARPLSIWISANTGRVLQLDRPAILHDTDDQQYEGENLAESCGNATTLYDEF